MARVCVDDWTGLNCGDKVHRKEDPRHVARVEAISHGRVRLHWPRSDGSDLGMSEYVDLFSFHDEFTIVKKARVRDGRSDPRDRAKTLALSPRAKLEAWLRGQDDHD